MQSSLCSAESLYRKRVAKLVELQKFLPTQPYSVVLRLRLAIAYKQLGYPDLAAGDAYKALLLVDEVVEEGEYHEDALTAAKADIASTQAFDFAAEARLQLSGLKHAKCCCSVRPEILNEENGVITWAKSCWSKTAYYILVGCLIDCGCLRTAFDYNTRALKVFDHDPSFESYRSTIDLRLHSYFDAKGENLDSVDVSEYPDKGLVRRELYPWNEHEPDRYSADTLAILNEEMAIVGPKLEVRISNLPILSPRATDSSSSEPSSAHEIVRYMKQLGVFAREEIPPGEVILQEKSLLTAVSRLHELYCDACSIPLPKIGEVTESTLGAEEPRACEDCDVVFFCSADCEELAQASYHTALCGINTEQKVPASEAADSLYSLLLIRALALAEVQDLHPLELKEVRYIWGDYNGLDLDRLLLKDSSDSLMDSLRSIPQTLPFSFTSNILMPLNVLEKMDINIFEQSDRYDTWIFNTLYAKFRGTASARQGLDGRPEIAAVHPMWCLANHSCDPNVEWEWQGSMKLWTREQLVDWKGRDPAIQPGIRKGEELLSHYCDIRLPVKERREWASGALGGECMCPRCVWEEAEEKRSES